MRRRGRRRRGKLDDLPAGEVYDARSNGCVKQRSEVLPERRSPIMPTRWPRRALRRGARRPQPVARTKTPRGPQLSGYATRKLGRSTRGSAITRNRSRSIHATQSSASILARPMSSKATSRTPRRSSGDQDDLRHRLRGIRTPRPGDHQPLAELVGRCSHLADRRSSAGERVDDPVKVGTCLIPGHRLDALNVDVGQPGMRKKDSNVSPCRRRAEKRSANAASIRVSH